MGSQSVAATPHGYLELEQWALTFGEIKAFGVEGTGSYGAALSRLLLARRHRVIEVSRPNRLVHGRHDKNVHLDAEGAARSVLNGQASAVPKPQDGTVEMIRQLKIVRDTAVKSRSQAMVTLKSLVINAPAALREELGRCRGKMALIRLIATFRVSREWTLVSSGRTNRFRLNRGGNRQANAALYRVAIVRMRNHPPTLAYVAKRTADGKTRSEIIRCLKRDIVGEIFTALCRPKEVELAA